LRTPPPPTPLSPLSLHDALPIWLAAADHERLDGGGYPRGALPHNAGMAARLLAAADVYQALREPRPHRPAHDPARAAQIIVEERSEEHTSELQSRFDLVCRLLLE